MSEFKIKSAIDSISMINKIINSQVNKNFSLDPPNLSDIAKFNMDHLNNLKNEGIFNEEQTTQISDAIVNADSYIKNNSGGGGSKNVVYFFDCSQGYVFGLDFPSLNLELKLNEVYNLSGRGYFGCGQVTKQPTKPVPIYTDGNLYKIYADCGECKNNIG